MVYLAWHSNVFGKRLVEVFSTEEKGNDWLEEAVRNGGERKGSIIRKEGFAPPNSQYVDYGETWWIESREVK